MVDAVEEVGIAERDVAGAGCDLLVDVGEDGVDVDDPDSAVEHHRHGAVPAPVRAAARRLDVPDRPGLAGDLEVRVATRLGEQVACREGRLERHYRVGPFDPAHEGDVGVAVHERVGHVRTHRGVEAVASDRLAAGPDGGGRAHREAGRGVHRHRERDLVGPRRECGVPLFEREIEQANVVASGPQDPGRTGDAERLMAELVRRNQQHLHVITISMRWAAVRRAASTSAGDAARANRNPR